MELRGNPRYGLVPWATLGVLESPGRTSPIEVAPFVPNDDCIGLPRRSR